MSRKEPEREPRHGIADAEFVLVRSGAADQHLIDAVEAVPRFAGGVDGERQSVRAAQRKKVSARREQRCRRIGANVGILLRLRQVGIVSRARVDVEQPLGVRHGAPARCQRAAQGQTQSQPRCPMTRPASRKAMRLGVRFAAIRNRESDIHRREAGNLLSLTRKLDSIKHFSCELGTADADNGRRHASCCFTNVFMAILKQASEVCNGHGSRSRCSLLRNFAVQVPIYGREVRRFPWSSMLYRKEFPMVSRSTVASEGGAAPPSRLLARCMWASGSLPPLARACT